MRVPSGLLTCLVAAATVVVDAAGISRRFTGPLGSQRALAARQSGPDYTPHMFEQVVS